MIVRVPQFPWYGDTQFALDFPTSWEVVTCHMQGENAPKLSDKDMQTAFLNPIGTPRIAEIARHRKEVVILFDDLSRPTKVAELVPYVLKELEEGGIGEERIRFIAAIGAHGAMKLMDFVKKLGPEVVKRFPVYNHCPFENCTFLGNTSRGTPVSINSEVMSCDLKIAIGSILPHPTAGFGGGGKMILPGVAHMDTIRANHLNLQSGGQPVSKSFLERHKSWGKVEGNDQRLDIEETARIAGLDVIINTVVNLHRDTIGLFVGDLVAAHREGVKLASEVYATEVPDQADVVIANAYSKANEGLLMVGTGNKLLKEGNGALVIICNIPEGQICHYLSRSFGKNLGGALWRLQSKFPHKIKRMIALGPYVDRAGLDWLGPPELITLAESWSEIINILKNSYGNNVRVVVIPDATLQYFPGL